MRGTPGDEDWLSEFVRIILADAGNTRSQCKLLETRRDHPRGCGEHYRTCSIALIMPGSSSRMRGTPGHAVRPVHPEWIILADAGNTIQLPAED